MNNSFIKTTKVTHGVYYIDIEKANTRILCGTPSDVVKLLMKKGLISATLENGFFCEIGPTSILLSDITIQNFSFSNLCEFPILQMLYRQGLIIPNHPNNRGVKPIVMGLKEQVVSQIEYMFRGNYGLITQEEIQETGIDEKTAEAMMKMKLKFAFGDLKSPDELIRSIYLDDNIKAEISNEVFIKRETLNCYKIIYQDEEVLVDLNLLENQNYEIPYTLDFFNLKKSYFAIIHSGQGDGWSINQPSMSSVLMFQGKIYLIDAGPNIQNILLSLGIGLNDIEAIFHTHGHDDHFAGLTELLKIDHKIKYYSTKLIRVSVMKKLSALLGISQNRLDNCFEYIDLEFDKWNNIDGLEVRPVFSPHPIETNIFFFRTFWLNGFKEYAHFADIASLKILNNMVIKESDECKIGISKEFYEKIKKEYLKRVTLKKVDVGGGMIHGELIDFQEDKSQKIIIAHRTSDTYTKEDLLIANKADFGDVDELIPAQKDYLRHYATCYIKDLFPNFLDNKIQVLINCHIKNFEPNSYILKENEVSEEVFLILNGAVESHSTYLNKKKIIFSGTLIGDISAMTEKKSNETYKTLSYVNTLSIPKDIYIHYVGYDYLSDILIQRMSLSLLCEDFEIFSEFLSIKTQNKITKSLKQISIKNDEICNIQESGLYLLYSGKIEMKLNNKKRMIIDNGNSFAYNTIFDNTNDIYEYKALENSEIYFIPRDIIETIPIIYLKVYTLYQKVKK